MAIKIKVRQILVFVAAFIGVMYALWLADQPAAGTVSMCDVRCGVADLFAFGNLIIAGAAALLAAWVVR